MQGNLLLATVLIAPIVAYLVGSYIGRALRMKDYSWRLGTMLGVTALGVAITSLFWQDIKLGIDLSGGAILIYEVDQEKSALAAATGKSADEAEESGSVDMRALVDALQRRVNPSGVKQVVIREYGANQVEIIIPDVSEAEIEQIKDVIVKSGYLKFRILANEQDHADIINLANLQNNSSDPNLRVSHVVRENNLLRAEWIPLGLQEGMTLDDPMPYKVEVPQAVSRELNGRREALMIVDPDQRFRVDGSHLHSASAGFDDTANPSVNFRMNFQGARLFEHLTGQNLPDRQTGLFRRLGIVMDDELISAPQLRSMISDNGQITGQFTQAEVDSLVNVLNAGRLPAVLRPEPISENKISPLLGIDTIRKGSFAISISLAAVLVFMLVYYRFAGIVACLALMVNLVLIGALMILIQAAFTLPGLAGLVLTVGMSVDANVLIFERIREELSRGAALRMAIRNGFSRATTTIVDANITTLITALVLYVIGTDQIRGFAVTLILGILMSMFTAIFCSRAIFEIAERKRWIKRLSMMQLVGKTSFDFIGQWKIYGAVSTIALLIGVGAVVARGKQIFDIDFLGGTSVQAVLNKPLPIEQVRTLASSLADDVSVTQVSTENHPENTVYKIDTSLEKVEQLEAKIDEVFKDGGQSLLVKHSMTFTEPIETPQDATSAITPPRVDGRPVAVMSARTYADRRESDSRLLALAQDVQDQVEAAAESTDDAQLDLGLPNPPETDPLNAAGTEGTPTEPATDSIDASPIETPSNNDSAAGASTSTGDGSTPGSSPLGDGSTVIDVSSGVTYRTKSTLTFREMISARALQEEIERAATQLGQDPPQTRVSNPKWEPGSTAAFSEWQVEFTSDASESNAILRSLQTDISTKPYLLSSSTIGGAVAGKTQNMAIAALVTSIIGIVAYIWIRFQRVVFGLAAVVALIHDITITLGAVAVSLWLSKALGFLLIDEFKISLDVVAALLTIIGYSLNDTIVVFDRIREVRGRSPNLTTEMVNTSVNQTLSRTLLTSGTTLIVVGILYAMGGQGIHGFAFSLLIGVLVGTYSSIFVASPVLVWMANRAANQSKPAGAREKKVAAV